MLLQELIPTNKSKPLSETVLSITEVNRKPVPLPKGGGKNCGMPLHLTILLNSFRAFHIELAYFSGIQLSSYCEALYYAVYF